MNISPEKRFSKGLKQWAGGTFHGWKIREDSSITFVPSLNSEGEFEEGTSRKKGIYLLHFFIAIPTEASGLS